MSEIGTDELPSVPVERVTYISGNTFLRRVRYLDVDGVGLFEGDIVLGATSELEAIRQRIESPEPGVSFSIIVSGTQYRWTDGIIPFTIDPGLPSQQRVRDAIEHWQANTNLCFIDRTNEVNYVTFSPGKGCSSAIGMRGGQQFITLGTACSVGNVIHEIGHTVGLWHEQSREDRDQFVAIDWVNIKSGYASNFDQHITDGDDIGPYDYSSIMHYGRYAFAVDSAQDTITPKPNAVVQIGQRVGLSAGDVAAVNSIYPQVPGRKQYRIVNVKCLGSIEGVRFLNGGTLDGSVNLVADTGSGLSGTSWALEGDGTGGSFLKCLGLVRGVRFLNGGTLDASVDLVGDTAGFSGTHWAVQDDSDNQVLLKCLGSLEGARFLNGGTVDGSVGLVNDVSGFSGAHWQLIPVPHYQIVNIRCLGALDGVRFLDGGTQDGSVRLVGDTANSGTKWAVQEDGGGGFFLKCLGIVPGVQFLNGGTVDGSVDLVGGTGEGLSGTHWAVQDDGAGGVLLKCLGSLEGVRFLNGGTRDGSVSLVDNTGAQYSGTHWQLLPAA